MAPKTLLPGSVNPPPCDGLDIVAFAQAFRNTNTSYKFFWARALMRALANNKFQSCELSFVKMAAGMLDAARRAVCVFRLRLPKDDKLDKEWFPALAGTPHWDSKTLTRLRGDVFAPRARRIPGTIISGLTKYVPYLFMSPFFPGMTGVAGAVKFSRIKTAAAERFNGDSPPPYRFAENDNAIIVHPKWCAYFARNADIINAWIMWELTRYIQRINPNIPAIPAKLDETAEPKTNRQRLFWQTIIERQPNAFCIYTGERIDADNFALDHYIPWSFVAHDNMWNLVPVSVAGNAEKSDNLPSDNAYFNHFADMQHLAVSSLHKLPNQRRWESIFEPYLTDLNVNAFQTAVNQNTLHSALAGVIKPLLSIAQTRGFTPNWEFGEN